MLQGAGKVGLIESVLLIAALVGCASNKAATSPADRTEFTNLVVLYSAMVKNGRPPASEAEFKEAIKTRLAPMAAALKVTNPEALFISKRDGKPIIVLYGQRPSGPGKDVVAYEQSGVEGKRLVGFSLGMVEEADEARFRELIPTGAKTP